MVVQLFYLFIYIEESIIAYMYYSDNYENRLRTPKSILIACVLYLFAFLVNFFSNNNIILNLVVFFIINLVYSLISFKISIKNSIFHSSILLAIMVLTEIIIESTASVIMHIPLDAYKDSLLALIVLGIISKVLYLVICKIISILFSYKKNNITNDVKKNFALFLYPLIISVMLTLFLYASTIYNFDQHLNAVFILMSIISMIFCCLIFVINQKIQKQEDELINLQAEAQKNEINKTFYDLLEQKNEDQRVLAHDIKHHLSVINMMENIDDVKTYLAKVRPEFEKWQYIGKSKNKMLDLIISKYSYICETEHISFLADIRSSNLSFIEDNDLASILSNLLDNAVEAARETDNAEIRLVTKREKNFYVLSIVNSSARAPKSHGEKLITTKKDSLFHGYGTKSVERTAKKYDGICHWEYVESDKTFHYNIVFNTQADKVYL